jgi:SRSO17 transposase
MFTKQALHAEVSPNERDNSCRHAPCFDRWFKRFDDLLTHQAQKREFRNYIGGLLGESERKNLSQMADNAVGVTYHRLHPWCA